jgi:hypothetical protein
MAVQPVQPVQRSLRPQIVLSLSLLVVGVAALVVRAEIIAWRAYWSQYRLNLHYHALSAAKAATRHVAVPAVVAAPPPSLSLTWVAGMALSFSLALLTIGAMSILLVSVGRRVAWLPLAMVAMFLNDGIQVLDSYASWTPGVGRAVSVAVVAVAVLPVLLATRSRVFAAKRVPRVAVLAGVVAAVPLTVLFAGSGESGWREPAAALAVLAYGGLVASSAIDRRWLPAALALPVLVVPQIAWAIGDVVYGQPGSDGSSIGLALGLVACAALVFAVRLPWRWLPVALAIGIVVPPEFRGALVDGLNGYGVTVPTYLGPLVLTLALTVSGAALALFGPRLLGLWRKATHHGPNVAARRTSGAAA